MSACLFVFCLLVTHVYSLYASGCLLGSLFLIYLLWVYLSKKKKLSTPRKEVRCLSLLNDALLCKWSWLYAFERGAL